MSYTHAVMNCTSRANAFFLLMCSIRMGEAEELAGHTEQCRKLIVTCLKRFPLSENVWKRFVTLFLLTLGIR